MDLPRPIPASLFRTVALWVAVVSLIPWAGCDWSPKDKVLVQIDSSVEYSKATLLSEQVEPRLTVPLKWVDDNTWQTSAGLPNGRYQLVARSTDGAYFQKSLEYKQGIRRYRLAGSTPAKAEADPTQPAGPGPLLTFQILGTLNFLNGREAYVIGNGEKVVVQRGTIANGRLQVRIPEPGTYRVHVAVPGKPAYDAFLEATEISGDHDFGFIDLQSGGRWSKP